MSRTSLKIPAGLWSDDTVHAAAGRWADGSNVRFRLAMPQVIGGWEALTASLLGGVCRWVFGWSTNDNQLHFAFGTHTKLQVWVGGGLYDITPTLARPARLLATNPLATQNGDTTVTVTDPGHQLTTGDEVTITGVVAVGGITPNGTFTVTVVDEDTYSYENGVAASADATGGGSAIVVQPTEAFAAGQIDGTGQAGYGTGPYGAGGYATPTVDDYFPRTWSGGAFGPDLIASPRLGTIYQWLWEDTGVVAAPVRNAPNNVTHCLVSNRDFIFALGCNEETSGEFNASCVRHSSTGFADQWNTANDNSAREYVLPGGGRIVAGRNMGDYILVWTTSSLFLFSYVGQLTEVYRWELVGDKCGLIGPGAAVVVGQRAFWISPDGQFWTYSLGGEPTPFPCPIREDFADNLAAAQADKIVASSIGAFSEIRWDYPDARDGFENSRYIAVAVDGPDAGSWYRGQMARTAMIDAGPGAFPLGVYSVIDGVASTGQAYWHERGMSADGAAMSWFIESADQYMSDDRSLLVRSFWPDAQEQTGPVTLTLTSRFKPRGDETVKTYVFAADDEKVDVRASGRLFKMKFSGSASPTAFRLGKPVLDMVPTGGR